MQGPCESIKFVDNTTIIEKLPSKQSPSQIQSAMDSRIQFWTDQNHMNLNPSKAKQLHINFKKKTVDHLAYTIGGSVVRIIQIAKL